MEYQTGETEAEDPDIEEIVPVKQEAWIGLAVEDDPHGTGTPI